MNAPAVPLRIGSATDLAALQGLFTRAQFIEHELCNRLKIKFIHEVDTRRARIRLAAFDATDPQGVLARLFVLGTPVPARRRRCAPSRRRSVRRSSPPACSIGCRRRARGPLLPAPADADHDPRPRVEARLRSAVRLRWPADPGHRRRGLSAAFVPHAAVPQRACRSRHRARCWISARAAVSPHCSRAQACRASSPSTSRPVRRSSPGSTRG